LTFVHISIWELTRSSNLYLIFVITQLEIKLANFASLVAKVKKNLSPYMCPGWRIFGYSQTYTCIILKFKFDLDLEINLRNEKPKLHHILRHM
jgi:hypothetical protein